MIAPRRRCDPIRDPPRGRRVANIPDDLDFDGRFDALRSAYLAALPQRHADLAQYWKSCSRDPQSFDWSSLHSLVHRLSGSAPCYGLDQVGSAAREIDRLLSGKAPCHDPAVLNPAIELLLETIDAAMTTP